MNNDLKNAGLAGIFNLVLFIPAFVISFLRGSGLTSYTMTVSYIFVSLVMIVTTIFFYRGFIIIGKKMKNHFLTVTSYITIFGTIMYLLYDIASLAFPLSQKLILDIGIVVFFGIVTIFYSIGILQLKSKFGGFATATGVVGIIAGASVITVILVFVGLLLAIPVQIMEIIILYRAAEKF